MDRYERGEAQLNESQIGTVINGLNKIGYNTEAFSDKRCNICFMDYE